MCDENVQSGETSSCQGAGEGESGQKSQERIAEALEEIARHAKTIAEWCEINWKLVNIVSG